MASTTPEAVRHARRLLRWSLATLAATVFHHVYGALLYRTPWRIHGAVAAVPLASVLWLLVAAYVRGNRFKRLAGRTLAAIAVAGLIIAIGLFEGAYNHGVKDVLYLAGLSPEALRRFFPRPRYELPNNLIFEASGLAQVIPAVLTAGAWFRFVMALHRDGSPRGTRGVAMPARTGRRPGQTEVRNV
jgi:hypothetical protein